MIKVDSIEEIRNLLRERGISPTQQRVGVARLLFSRREHMSAEDLYEALNHEFPSVSKATVYNTLSIFVEHGLVRQVIADPERIYYDPNTGPHHHVFDVATGKLTDIFLDDVQIKGLPALPAGAQVEGVDVIVRVRTVDTKKI